LSVSAVLLIVAIALYIASIALLVVDVVRQPDFSPLARLLWALAMVIGSFFTVVIWFSQGRTGKAGRLGSILLVLAIGVSIAVVFIEAVRVL
jgi:hypothetical protein